MRIDVTPRASSRSSTPQWLRVMPAVGALVCGLALPLLGADTLDRFMKDRGWRDGQPRVQALAAWAKSWQQPSPDLPALRIDVRFKHYKKLLDQRAAALRMGRLDTDNDDFVPAKLRFKGEELAIKIRLQGDDVLALRGANWPLRVRVRGGQHVLGIERFTLRPPGRDGYYDKALAYDFLRKAALSPRYQFVTVRLNGKKLGVMGMEEYLSNELIDANRRPAGPLLRIGNASVLPQTATQVAASATVAAMADLTRARCEVVRAKRWQKDPGKARLADRGRALLDGFLTGAATPGDTFAAAPMARFLAAVESLGAAGFARWDNLRWYYNPILDRLEPVAYASGRLAWTDDIGIVRQSAVVERILRDPLIARLFRSLRVAAPGRFTSEALRSDYPMATVDLRPLRARRSLVRRARKHALADSVAPPIAVTGVTGLFRLEARTLVVGPGRVRIDRAVRLPHGASLTVLAGTHLNIAAGASLFVDGGAAHFAGTSAAPITVRLGSGRHEHSPAAITVAEGRVQWREVQVLGMSSVRSSPVVVGYKSDVEMESVQFKDVGGESVVRFVSCTGRIRDVAIEGAPGDGLALAHMAGFTAENVRIRRCAGDGVDVSGGRKLTLKSLKIEAFGDKGVSIGELAKVLLRDVEVSAGPVAVAIKDGSEVTLAFGEFRFITGSVLAVYTKKPRYGAARLTATEVTVRDDDNPRHTAHGDAKLTVNGARISPSKGALERLFKLGYLGSR